MRTAEFRIVSALVLLLTYILTSIMPANSLPAFAAAPRFAIDVNSQPIVVGGFIYVQARKDLVKLSLKDGN
jgi:hypothetical protein